MFRAQGSRGESDSDSALKGTGGTPPGELQPSQGPARMTLILISSILQVSHLHFTYEETETQRG